MKKEELTEGDEVAHRSGGPKMIYLGESSLGDALCEWTDPSGKPQRDAFAYAALKRYESQTMSGRITRA